MRNPRPPLLAGLAAVGVLAGAGVALSQAGWSLGQFNPLTGDTTKSMVVVNPATGAPYTGAAPLPVSAFGASSTTANPGGDATQATAVQGVAGGKAVGVTDTNGAAIATNTGATSASAAAISTATGLKADSAATDSSSSWSVIGLLKGLYAKLSGTLTATISGALPAGANVIGKVGIDQTTPGTTNLVWTPGYVGYNEYTAAALGSNASTSGTFRTAPSWASYYVCRGVNAQTGAIQISENFSGVNQNVLTQALTAGVPATIKVDVAGSGSTYACTITNGSTASASAQVESAFKAN